MANIQSQKLSSQVSGILNVRKHAKIDTALRALMFASSLVSVVVMVTSKQTAMIQFSPVITVPVDAKFTHSGSFTFFVAALAVTCLYSLVTFVASFSAMKSQGQFSTEHQLHLVLLDSLLLGLVASATGAGGGVAYEALKGNPHIHWMKICHIYDTFCDHLAAAGFVSLTTSMTLLLLIWLSVTTSGRALLQRE
ncbi:CASP-like protein 1D1 [Rutidosis leptorrhynchoides]|uniref:CASP-like protein 1D1 n=1 Tax=Rutidosis leptorrhynchoides TaxID=125765 RepID=UPI003A992B01